MQRKGARARSAVRGSRDEGAGSAQRGQSVYVAWAFVHSDTNERSERLSQPVEQPCWKHFQEVSVLRDPIPGAP